MSSHEQMLSESWFVSQSLQAHGNKYLKYFWTNVYSAVLNQL